jgi:broad specificity phosphatase PhoE
VEIDADLIDRDYGRWAGSSAAAVAAEFSSLDAAPGVEARERFTQRVTAAVVRAANRAWISPVVVVAHDAVNRQVLAQLVPGMGPAEVIPQRTGCWNRLEQVPGRWSAPIVDAVPGDGWTP